MSNQVATTTEQKDIFAHVLGKVANMKTSGELVIPKDYAVENAINSARIIISELKDKNGKSALEVCTRESISFALLKMVTEGLSPLKRQGSFIIYGDKLQWQREYSGNIALAKRFGGLKDIRPMVIYEGDEFEFAIENGVRKVVKHVQTLQSISSNKIVGAYAICEFEKGVEKVDIMTMPQIERSWNQGYAKGGSPAHKNFPDQMAMKTVINRACKLIINTSDDGAIIEDLNEPETLDVAFKEVRTEISNNANKQEIAMSLPTQDTKFTPTMVVEPVQAQPVQTEVPDAFK